MPHPQMASPLQQWVEELQAKVDPTDDKIEGLDAKVLHADALEEGEQAALDFEDQDNAPPTCFPPLHTSCPSPVPQQTPPP